jgi:hypothetical protein
VKSSNMVKIAAAFLIGVVVALGSALLYVRMDEVPDKAVAAIPPAPEANPIQPEGSASQAAPEPSPAPEAAMPTQSGPKPLPKVKTAARPKPVRPTQVQTKEPITVIAQNYPPAANSLPAPARMPARPTVNEPSPLPPAPVPAPVESVAPTSTPVREPHVVTLQAGTNLAIRLGEALTSDHNYPGDTFRASLTAPIVVDGFIIADRGSKVLGKVITAQAAGRVQGVSELTLVLTEINTTDGQRVHIQTDFYSKKGPESTGTDAAKIAGGAAIGAIIGAIAGGGKGAAIGAGAGGAAGTGIVLATRGRPTTLSSETPLMFRLSAPVIITEQFNN